MPAGCIIRQLLYGLAITTYIENIRAVDLSACFQGHLPPTGQTLRNALTEFIVNEINNIFIQHYFVVTPLYVNRTILRILTDG